LGYDIGITILIGGPELKKLVEKAKQDRRSWNKSTIIFIDEIHRLNKAQQGDFLLPMIQFKLIYRYTSPLYGRW
jgi:putative ATPase